MRFLYALSLCVFFMHYLYAFFWLAGFTISGYENSSVRPAST
jgi:hypothetical protein